MCVNAVFPDIDRRQLMMIEKLFPNYIIKDNYFSSDVSSKWLKYKIRFFKKELSLALYVKS